MCCHLKERNLLRFFSSSFQGYARESFRFEITWCIDSRSTKSNANNDIDSFLFLLTIEINERKSLYNCFLLKMCFNSICSLCFLPRLRMIADKAFILLNTKTEVSSYWNARFTGRRDTSSLGTSKFMLFISLTTIIDDVL